MSIFRYKFSEFLTADIPDRDTYFTLFKYLEPKISVTDKHKPIHTLSFIDVRTMMDYFSGKRQVNGDAIAWMVSSVSECQEKYIYQCDTFEVFSVLNFIRNEVQKLIENENFRLADSNPDPKAVQAGVDVFNQFGIYNELEKLSGGNVLLWQQCMDMPYYLAFKKLHLEHETAQFQRRYSQIKN